MKILEYRSIKTSAAYEKLVKALYAGVKQKAEEVFIPSVKIIAVTGNEPPAGEQYQTAIASLYGIGYTLKMGLKFKKLPKPKGYFDYAVGGLETLWWSKEGTPFEISNPQTLRWKAYLMVPAFIDTKTFEKAVEQASAKKPEVPYKQVSLEEFEEGASVQMLHIGPYDKERPTVQVMENYMEERGLVMVGKYHEIYISDPRRTKPNKLKTVIRFPVKSKDGKKNKERK